MSVSPVETTRPLPIANLMSQSELSDRAISYRLGQWVGRTASGLGMAYASVASVLSVKSISEGIEALARRQTILAGDYFGQAGNEGLLAVGGIGFAAVGMAFALGFEHAEQRHAATLEQPVLPQTTEVVTTLSKPSAGINLPPGAAPPAAVLR